MTSPNGLQRERKPAAMQTSFQALARTLRSPVRGRERLGTRLAVLVLLQNGWESDATNQSPRKAFFLRATSQKNVCIQSVHTKLQSWTNVLGYFRKKPVNSRIPLPPSTQCWFEAPFTSRIIPDSFNISLVRNGRNREHNPVTHVSFWKTLHLSFPRQPLRYLTAAWNTTSWSVHENHCKSELYVLSL